MLYNIKSLIGWVIHLISWLSNGWRIQYICIQLLKYGDILNIFTDPLFIDGLTNELIFNALCKLIFYKKLKGKTVFIFAMKKNNIVWLFIKVMECCVMIFIEYQTKSEENLKVNKMMKSDCIILCWNFIDVCCVLISYFTIQLWP